MTNPIIHPTTTRNTTRKIHFTEVPEVGTVVPYYAGSITLVKVVDRVKKDGSPGVLLVWQRSDGIIATSGMSSNSLTYNTRGIDL